MIRIDNTPTKRNFNSFIHGIVNTAILLGDPLYLNGGLINGDATLNGVLVLTDDINRTIGGGSIDDDMLDIAMGLCGDRSERFAQARGVVVVYCYDR